MFENKWDDKLRRKMADYEQTTPDGLWEAVEAGLPGRRTGFGWWWVLAGAAAAVLAVVLVVRPGGWAVPDGNLLTETTESGPQTTETVFPADTMDKAATPLLIAEAKPDSVPGKPARTEIQEQKSSAPVQPAILPADNDVPAADIAPAADDSPVHDTPADQVTKEEYKAPVPPETPSRDYFREDVRTAGVINPKVSFGVVGNAVNAAPASAAFTEYGMPSPIRAASGRTPSVATLSRNKATDTNVDYSLLSRAGLLLNIGITKHWGVETGLQLSRLGKNSRSVTGDLTSSINTTSIYLGVPLLAVYTPLRTDHFSIYASAGPTVEFGTSETWNSYSYIGSKLISDDRGTNKLDDMVWSLGVNAGAQLTLFKVASVFVQPGLSWYLGGEESFYTKRPLAFSLAAGVRLTL